MAAPIKNVKREKYIKIRVTEAEKLYFQNLIEGTVYNNMSEMIRDITLNGHYKILTVDNNLKQEYAVLISQCKRIGNNFNTFLKLLHQKKLNYFTHGDIEILTKNISEINKFFKKIDLK